jgi:uncharacterized protein YciU (UPF0263 family)
MAEYDTIAADLNDSFAKGLLKNDFYQRHYHAVWRQAAV